jgi:excisionase family DNA binding protein
MVINQLLLNNAAFTVREYKMMLTTQQAATRLSVHPETIRRMVKAGRLKAIALSGTKNSRLRIDDCELQAFIDGNTQAMAIPYPVSEEVIYDRSKPPKQGTYQPPPPYSAIKLSIGEPYPLTPINND